MLRYLYKMLLPTNLEKDKKTARRHTKNADNAWIFAKEKPKPNTLVFDLGFDWRKLRDSLRDNYFFYLFLHTFMSYSFFLCFCRYYAWEIHLHGRRWKRDTAVSRKREFYKLQRWDSLRDNYFFYLFLHTFMSYSFFLCFCRYYAWEIHLHGKRWKRDTAVSRKRESLGWIFAVAQMRTTAINCRVLIPLSLRQ